MFTDDVVAINQLGLRYAAAVDACDLAAFQGVFHAMGRLRSYHPDAAKPFADLRDRVLSEGCREAG